MSNLVDYIVKLAQEFEEAVPETIRSGLSISPENRSVQIDLAPSSSLDEVDLAYLRTSVVFGDIEQLARQAEQLIKSKDWDVIYDTQEGIMALSNKIENKLQMVQEMIKELP